MQKTALIIIIVLVAVIILGYFAWQGQKGTASPSSNNPSSFMIQNMKVEILTQGTGTVAKNGDKVSVNYVGTFPDGTKFDSNNDKNNPFPFILGVGQVIKGWDLGVAGMKIGEKRRLTIPADLGYGASGTPGGPIPPNATLIFEVELLGVNQ